MDWIHLAPVASFCEHSSEVSGSMKGGK